MAQQSIHGTIKERITLIKERISLYVVVMITPGGKGLFTAFIKKKSSVAHVLIEAEPQALATRHRREDQEAEDGPSWRAHRSQDVTVSGTTWHCAFDSYTAPNSSAGSAEAYIHILQDAMSAMLNHYATLHGTERPHHLWEYAFRYAAEVKTMTWTTTNDGVSMCEKQTGRPPPLDKCHVFGATVFANVPKAQRGGKGSNRGRSGRFMGFAENGPGFVILDHKTNKVFHSYSVRVHDKACSQQQQVEDANVVDAVDK